MAEKHRHNDSTEPYAIPKPAKGDVRIILVLIPVVPAILSVIVSIIGHKNYIVDKKQSKEDCEGSEKAGPIHPGGKFKR
jgi:hypothetical protein